MFKDGKDAERREPPAILRYGLAVLCVAAVIMATELTGVRLGVVAPAVCAVLLTAWYGGMGPGLLAWALSVLAIAFFFAPPTLEFRVDAASVPTYILTSLTVLLATWISAKQRSTAISSRQTRDALDEKVRDLAATEYRFRNIFDTAGVSIWEADFTAVERVIEELRRTGVRDFAAYFAANPEIVKQAVSLVKIVNVNEATVKLFEAANKEQLLAAFPTLFTPETLDAFTEQLIVIAERRTFFGADMRCRTVRGHELSVLVTMALPPRPCKLDSVLSTVTDITERKRAEEALRESEYELRQIIDTVPGLIWATGPDGEPTHVSQRLLDYSGMGFEEFRHRGWEAFVHPDDFPETARAFYDAIQTGTSYHGVLRLRRADGEFRWHHARCEPLRNQQGRIIQWYGLSVDIAEDKKAEEQPRFVAQLQAILNVLPAYTWYAAPSGALTFVNKRTADYLGVPNDHPLRFGIDIGAQWDDWVPLLHPDDREESRKYWSNCLRTGEAGEHSYRIRNAQGDYSWFLTRFEPLRASDGTLLLWVGATLDIEALKFAEQALRESEGKLRDYAETASDWFWEIGPDYKFTMLTENAFGSDPAERIGTACWDHALDLETEREKWRVLRATLDLYKPFRDFVYYTVGGKGLPMYVRASGKPVFDANGEFRGYRGTGTDVTSIIQAEEAARESQADLARVSRMTTLGELAASIAHEINQPLGAIVTNTGAGLRWLNMESPNISEVRETLARIQKDGNRAADVIGRVRALARKAPVQKDGLSINDVIADVIALTRGELDRSRVLLHTNLADGLPAVSGDKVQLQQVILNLIVNAIEAMRHSERRHLAIASQEDADGNIRVSVRDSGGGLKPESIDQIFKSFFTTKPGGMGMGLSICRSIIEMHGGRLSACTNAPHEGATFEFALPSQAHSFVAQPHSVARENPRQAIP